MLCVPSNDDLLRVHLVVQVVHRVVILHVYRDLLGGLAVQDRERSADLDLAGVSTRAK